MSDQTDKAALPGHAADSPSNSFLAPGRLTETPPGWAAVNHPVTQSRGVTVMHQQQNTVPVVIADMATAQGCEGPLAEAIRGHARVQGMSQVEAANPGLLEQLGSRAPSGIPGQPADHIAPTGAQLDQRRQGPPAMPYTRTGGELQGLQGGPA